MWRTGSEVVLRRASTFCSHPVSPLRLRALLKREFGKRLYASKDELQEEKERQLKEDTFRYHTLNGKAGKIEITPTKPLVSQRDLSLAYSPGVAYPVLAIADEVDASLQQFQKEHGDSATPPIPIRSQRAYDYTAKGNLVGVISNGSAILGLGNRGAIASKPVMEGKGVLFKSFADVDVFDIEVDIPFGTGNDQEQMNKFVTFVEQIAPTFGGVNLEDIRAPECFFIEEELKKRCNIPVFHDDQHGTAIIATAGLINAVYLTGKKMKDVRMVVNGAGASANSCAKMAIAAGVRPENILMVDRAGVIYKGRTKNMNKYKEPFAVETQCRTLEDAMVGADVFYGLSVADVLTVDMVKSMNKKPIIFAMANPNPEIRYELAKEAAPDSIVATGRSDYPNQVNNVLGFPFIFRGALDVRATAINEDMKLAAAQALARLAREPIPDSVLTRYNLKSLRFSEDYIIPKPFDPRVLTSVAPAVAEAAVKSGVAAVEEFDVAEYRQNLSKRLGRGQELRQFIIDQAKAVNQACGEMDIRSMERKQKRIVFTEGEEEVIIKAAAQIQAEGIGHPVLIGSEERIQQLMNSLGVQFSPTILDHQKFPLMEDYVNAYYHLRARKGVTLEKARKKMRTNVNTFGAMVLKMGHADAFVSGLTFEYPEVIRPALQINRSRGLVCGVYIMIIDHRVLVFSDATVNVAPSAEQLSAIAIEAADFAARLQLTPKVAMLSFSNFGSAPHSSQQRISEAVHLVHAERPDILIDGEMQADTAVIANIVEERYPFSKVKEANVLVFPSLEAANICYKLLDSRALGKAHTIGPILLGMNSPCHVLQTGATVDDVVNIAAVAVWQSEWK